MESGVSAIVALANAAYECSINAKELGHHVARIDERLHWIICRSEEWQYICSPDYKKDTYHRMEKALEGVNLVMQAASSEPKNWRSKVIKFVGSKHLKESLLEAEAELNVVLQDLQVDQSSFMLNELHDELKSVKDVLEMLHSSTSTTKTTMTFQDEMDEALDIIMEQKHEIALDSHHPSKKNLKKLEINLDDLVFDEKDMLGGGAFADVIGGTYENSNVAIKRLKIDVCERKSLSIKKLKKDAKKIAAEAYLAHRCSIHPNIVQVYGYHVGSTDNMLMERPLIVMERMSTTLFEELHYHKDNPPTFTQRFEWLHGIARALEFLHLQGIVHHDVKTLNILLDASKIEAKLSDFGEAKVKGLNTTKVNQQTMLSTSVVQGKNAVAGTVAYQAPELFSDKVIGSSRVSEMYSFGVTVWECLTGKIPHRGKKESNICFLMMMKDKPPLKMPTKFPQPEKSDDENKEDDPDKQEDDTSISLGMEEEMDSWNRLHFVAKTCTSRDRDTRLTSTQVVKEWNKICFPNPEDVVWPKKNKSLETTPEEAPLDADGNPEFKDLELGEGDVASDERDMKLVLMVTNDKRRAAFGAAFIVFAITLLIIVIMSFSTFSKLA